jgi:hypothetical protein
VLDQVRGPTTDATAFRAGELARDSLRAPRLAARLFLDVSTRWPGSLFAPKAIIAAMALLPERRDSLRAVLDADYPASPYALALHGLPAPGFAAAEDSLARALGSALTVERASVTASVGAPRPGPRSVWLEPPPDPSPGRATRAATPAQQRPSERRVEPAA